MLAFLTHPDPAEHAPPFARYIALVPAGNPLAFLETQLAEVLALYRNLTDQDALAIHAPYSWTLKQVLGHIADTEQIFSARALRIARRDTTPLPPFDENAYMDAANFNQIPLADLLAHFSHLRQAHLLLFRNLPAESWLFAGNVNQHAMTPRALLYAIAGHAQHHLSILHHRLGK